MEYTFETKDLVIMFIVLGFSVFIGIFSFVANYMVLAFMVLIFVVFLIGALLVYVLVCNKSDVRTESSFSLIRSRPASRSNPDSFPYDSEFSSFHTPTAPAISSTRNERKSVSNVSAEEIQKQFSQIEKSNRLKSVANRPNEYTMKTDIKLWWPKFELYVQLSGLDDADIKNVLRSFMNDECLNLLDHSLPNYARNMDDFKRIMIKIFDTPKEMSSLRTAFYSRQQRSGESIRTFMTILWGLAREAFTFDVEDKHRYESLVTQQFIHGLKNPHIKSNLRISKPDTTNEAVDRACELAVDFPDELESKNNSSFSDSILSPSKSVSFNSQTSLVSENYQSFRPQMMSQSANYGTPHNNFNNNYQQYGNRNQRNKSPLPQQRNIDRSTILCYNCNYYGHFSRECPYPRQDNQNQNNSGSRPITPNNMQYSNVGYPQQSSQQQVYQQVPQQGQQQTPTKSVGNVSVHCKDDQLIGFFKVNGMSVKFLFDTGSPKTLISEDIWMKICENSTSEFCVLKPYQHKISTCDKKPINVLGSIVCEIEGFGFKGQEEIMVIKDLDLGCLLGLDISMKIKPIRSLLEDLKVVLNCNENIDRNVVDSKPLCCRICKNRSCRSTT